VSPQSAALRMSPRTVNVDCVEQLAWSTRLCRCVGHTVNSREVGSRQFSAAVTSHTSLVSRLRFSRAHTGEDSAVKTGVAAENVT
jgi:hypothetical protein